MARWANSPKNIPVANMAEVGISVRPNYDQGQKLQSVVLKFSTQKNVGTIETMEIEEPFIMGFQQLW